MNVYFLSVLFSIFFLVIVVDMMRRRLLLEQYSLFWLGMGVVIFFLSVFHGLIDHIAHNIGILYAPSLLFLVGFLFLLGTMLHLTLALSKLTTRTIRLVQEVGILRAELEKRDERVPSAQE